MMEESKKFGEQGEPSEQQKQEAANLLCSMIGKVLMKAGDKGVVEKALQVTLFITIGAPLEITKEVVDVGIKIGFVKRKEDKLFWNKDVLDLEQVLRN